MIQIRVKYGWMTIYSVCVECVKGKQTKSTRLRAICSTISN